uniref:Uncharacterized protein n=1 Tax=Oryza sativa subsp. japonica TaxID=39947 RepID=Q6ZF23_ORYSJ|nr:hypothetical protein [Oryza sativa Japonica Group]BAD31631.1 hypothetical protein [Oryza sativa Japonica Group]
MHGCDTTAQDRRRPHLHLADARPSPAGRPRLRIAAARPSPAGRPSRAAAIRPRVVATSHATARPGRPAMPASWPRRRRVPTCRPHRHRMAVSALLPLHGVTPRNSQIEFQAECALKSPSRTGRGTQTTKLTYRSTSYKYYKSLT